MNSEFPSINSSLLNYFNVKNQLMSEFYCRLCGNCMIDFSNLTNVQYITRSLTRGTPLKHPDIFIVKDNKIIKKYVESPLNMWLIRGRTLSGKTFFRRICWNCFFKQLREHVDIAGKARKSSWYKKLLDGDNIIPPAWTSPSKDVFSLLFDITDEELQIEHMKFDTASKDSFIRRHGQISGLAKYETYCARQSYTCSKEYMVGEKGMSEQEWHEFNASRASTKQNFIKRYGKADGIRRWNDYCTYEAYAGNSLQYFIDKYGDEEGPYKYLEVNSKKSLTLDNFIVKYGETEGRLRFNASNNKAYSEISQNLFKRIDDKLGEFARDSRYEQKNSEECINLFFDDGACKACRVDYKLNTKIIEFFGDYWHANPAKYSADYIMFNGDETIVATDIWSRDSKRIDALKKLGYSVHIVWEKDFKANPDKVIDECIVFLKS